MATSSNLSIPYQTSSDTPNGPTLGQGIATRVDDILTDGTEDITVNTVTTTSDVTINGSLTVTGSVTSLITPQHRYLTGSDTVASTTFADSSLFLSGNSGEVWKFCVELYHKMTSTGDLQLRFTQPSGTVHWGVLGPTLSIPTSGTSTAANEYRNRQGETASPTATLVIGSMTDGNGVFSRINGLWLPSAGGTLRLQFATYTAAGSISLLPGSSIEGRRMA